MFKERDRLGLLESLVEKVGADITPVIREEVAVAMTPLLKKMDELIRLLTLIEAKLP